MTIRRALDRLWSDLKRPTDRTDGPYEVLVQAIGHAVLGAAFGTYFALGFAGPTLIITAYWLIKELPDLKRGGAVLDGVVDTTFVGIGTLYGPAWWPSLVLGSALVLVLLRAAFTDFPEDRRDQ